MITLVLASLMLGTAPTQDTIVLLSRIERDLTADGRPETLSIIGRGASIDSLDVTFSIESSGELVFRSALEPLTSRLPTANGVRRATIEEHRTRLREFGASFFDARKFMTTDTFLVKLRRSARLHVDRIPVIIGRSRRREFLIDSLRASGRSLSEAEDAARALLGRVGAAETVWRDIQNGGVVVFEFSPGGDRIRAIAWSTGDRRFYDLIECC